MADTKGPLVWHAVGEKKWERGVSNVALYPTSNGTYGDGVAWNGVINITESPSGAEATALWADNVKYANLISAEEFGATIEAYTYPDAFAECDGSATIATGVTIGQQTRKTFGLAWKSLIGNDTESDKFGYKIKIAYGLTAAPSERANNTVNENSETMTMSWELKSTPVNVKIGDNEYKPTSLVTVDSTKFNTPELKTKLKALEDFLYGSSTANAQLPLPEKVAELIGAEG